MSKKLKIAIAGNPNSGKTTIFNNLTGARQHVGNYPGVTVEKIEGYSKYAGYHLTIVDLPGIYSLTAHSIDELVARNYILDEKPDVVIDIVDTSNLERNLYLSTQLMELGVKIVIALNMWDIAKKLGLEIDHEKLSQLLGVPCVPTIATKKEGMDELLQKVIALHEGRIFYHPTPINYGREIEEEISKIEEILKLEESLLERYPSRWLAIKRLEKDEDIYEKVKKTSSGEKILQTVEKSIEHLTGIFGEEPEAVIPDRRYGFISGACSAVILRSYELRHTLSDKIDRIFLNRVIGLPIFFFLMWIMFKAIFRLSEPFTQGIENLMNWIGKLVGSFFPEGSIIKSLIVDGIIGGVGSVLTFVPVIFLLFFFIAILEDSGYLARAAFLMDRIMNRIGLHGRSYIPLLLGFGCNVPAIMATRVIDDRKSRLITILVNPFMSCGARLPVYTLFVGTFFSPRQAGNILFSLYLLGILVAMGMSYLFRRLMFKGESTPFVMELPPYRLPTLKGVLIHMWERGVVYLKKAGTVIFAGCMLIWFLSHFPSMPEEGNPKIQLEKSYAGKIGKFITPVFKPLGFGEWKASIALIAGFIAKELVVGTLGTLYGKEEETSLREMLKNDVYPDGSKVWSPLSSYSFLIFILLYIPCIATIAVIYRETQSLTWPLFTAFYTTALAWIISFLFYQTGKFLLSLG
ncbi:MAG TPA: ferrous iron transport protein B [bacterium]|nr:ferrous iron transport protein B [bacterium]HEX67475.1 ferrous iron transport protein B [bacterium]